MKHTKLSHARAQNVHPSLLLTNSLSRAEGYLLGRFFYQSEENATRTAYQILVVRIAGKISVRLVSPDELVVVAGAEPLDAHGLSPPRVVARNQFARRLQRHDFTLAILPPKCFHSELF